jgi:hypothetical protein
MERTDYRAGQPVVSQSENPAGLIHTAGFRLCGGAVNRHDLRYDPVDSFGTLLLGRLPIVGRVFLDGDVVSHPAQDRIPTVRQLAGQHQFLQLLRRPVHAGITLPEGNNLKIVATQLSGVPAVDCFLTDVVLRRSSSSAETLPRLRCSIA